MMSCRPLLVVRSVLPLLLLALPTHAQETDTTMAGEPAADTTQVAPGDTTDAPATDTTQAAAADTATAERTPADSAAAAADSVAAAADSAAVTADSMVADTALSVKERRARAKKRARAAASSWLELTDAGQFGKSWDTAAPSLQKKMSREAWMKRGAQARSTLDTLKSRKFAGVRYRDSTDQLSTGGPVVALQYRSEFEGGSVLEAVITTKQDDTWKVAGYRVVPAPPSKPASDSTAAGADSTAAGDNTSQQ